MNGLFILYTLIFYFKNTKTYIFAILLAISISTVFIWYKTILLIVIFIGAQSLKISYKYFIFIFFILFLLLLYKLDINAFSFHAQRYVFKEDLLKIMDFRFVAPMQHILEAKSTNILSITNLISGNIFLFFCATIGYVLLVAKHKEMILALPLVVLGILSIYAGTRFHIYATAIFSISYFFLFYYISTHFKLKNLMFIYITIIISLPPIYENYKEVKYWKYQGCNA